MIYRCHYSHCFYECMCIFFDVGCCIAALIACFVLLIVVWLAVTIPISVIQVPDDESGSAEKMPLPYRTPVVSAVSAVCGLIGLALITVCCAPVFQSCLKSFQKPEGNQASRLI